LTISVEGYNAQIPLPIGTPEEEREAARAREKRIAEELADGRGDYA